MRDESQENARKRIEMAMEITGYSASKLASEGGMATSTLSRFMHQPVKYTLSMRSMEKVDAVVRRFLERQPPGPDVIAQQIRYFKTAPDALEPVEPGLITLFVRGSVQAGHWAEAMESPAEDWQKITLPRPDDHRSFFGLKVKGPSMNQVYPEGTILVCVPMLDYHHALEDGDHVIVQRWDTGEVEATVKELRHTPDHKAWLWPRSDHPEHQAPIELPQNPTAANDADDVNQDSDIRVVAVVVADYRVRARNRPSGS